FAQRFWETVRRLAMEKADKRSDDLLRPCRERPRRHRPTRCRPAEQRDDLAAPDHSITSSARARILSGTSMPSALAVLRLMMSSNLVGCITGSSEGLSPLRIRPT